jgi:outer membrane protein assembly factor BamB
MRGFILARRALLFVAVAALAFGSFHKATVVQADLGTLADHGVRALEKLPWKSNIIRANLSKRIPMSIAGCYLMEKQILVVGASGKVYCLDRRNLEPRWVNALRFPLAQPPAEGPTHYAFLLKDQKGAHWIHTISKRSGAASTRFPVRLNYTASSGIDVNASGVFIGSLGSVGNNKTLETVNLLTGRPGWGYRNTGMLWGAPTLSPDGEIVVTACDDGVVTALAASASAPSTENWIRDLGGGVRGRVAVTPAHVFVGNDDGILYCLDLFSGRVNWLQGLDERIRAAPWVFGSHKVTKHAAGVDGAADVEVKRYEGLVFARNVKGLHAFDLRSGAAAFSDPAGGRPLVRNGKYLLTVAGKNQVTIRDASDGFKVVGKLNLGMFDLVPCNDANGEIFACTADGNIVAAIPK